mgnify:CR=1 FL=1
METDEQFYRRLNINHDNKKCEKRWQKHHDKIIRDAREYCREIWEGSGNFTANENINIYWKGIRYGQKRRVDSND